MLQGEHSAILWTFIKLQFVINISVLSNFEWLLKTGFTVVYLLSAMVMFGVLKMYNVNLSLLNE